MTPCPGRLRRGVTAGVRALGCVCAALLAACAAPQWEQPGAARAEVQRRLGAPTATYALDDGERLQYSQQPAGQQVHNLDFDPAGRLRRVEQVLQPRVFERIEPGRWRGADVRRQFGPPARIGRVGNFDGEVWTWRYEEAGFWRLLHVFMDPREDRVRDWSTADEGLPDSAH